MTRNPQIKHGLSYLLCRNGSDTLLLLEVKRQFNIFISSAAQFSLFDLLYFNELQNGKRNFWSQA
jgi:hypothetical protein